MSSRQPAGWQPRLVATDLDGTLLRSDGTVSDRTRQALELVAQRGVPVVFVTARPLRWMDDLWPLVGDHGLAIVSNGAIVKDVAHDRLVEVRGIDPALGLDLVAGISALLPDARYALEDPTGIRIGHGFDEPGAIPPDTPYGAIEDLWTGDAAKLMVRAPTADPVVLRERVLTAVGDRAVVTWTMDGLMEVSAPGVTKASALAGVASHLNVAPAETLAFGDMPNDLPMLSWAGRGVAVANAHPTLQEVADAVTASNDDDGVALVLEDFFGTST